MTPLAAVMSSLSIAAVHLSTNCPADRAKVASLAETKCYAMEYGGRERTLRIYVPAQASRAASAARDGRGASAARNGGGAGPVPLVLVLHGSGGDGGGMEWVSQRGFNRIADREGAVIVYPDGIGKSWNDGRPDVSSAAVKESVDDLGWLRALPDALAAFNIDKKRVYAAGMSNGGLMSLRLACDAADVFAAVAPVVANMSVDLAPVCKPARPIPVLIMNGTADPIMPFAGGPVKVLWFKRGSVLSTNATVARLAELEQCGPLRNDGGLVSDPQNETSVVKQVAQCPGGGEIDLYEIRGGGHTWPGGEPYLSARIVGKVSRAIDANETIWQFFARYHL